MGPGPQHSITEVEPRRGELAFRAQVGGLDKRLFIRTDADLVPEADAALAICLLPAMRAGGTLTMAEPVSPRLLRGQREFGAIQRAWSTRWQDGAPLREVEVRAPGRDPAPRQPRGRVAAFFSGGVDSFATVLEEPELTDLIFVRGIDLLAGNPDHAAVDDEVERRLRAAAAELGLSLHTVETNARELADPLVPWEAYYPSPLSAIALFFEPLFDRVLIATANEYANQAGIGASRLVDQLWSTEGLEIVDAGGRLSRAQRIARIGAHPVVRETLRVCWENPGGAYNCGRCRKCLMTMVTLEALGLREGFETFPAELDLEAVAAVELLRPPSLVFWEDVLTTVRECGRVDLEGPVLEVLNRGRGHLPEPKSWQRAMARAKPEAANEITDLRVASGELSFEARIGGERERIWFRTDTAVTPNADAALAACLMPAMRAGGTLSMAEPVSPKLLRGARELGAIQCTFSERWELPDEPLSEVDVQAPARVAERRQPTGRVAAFFSAGIDSFAAVLDNPDLTDLIFVRGVDLLPGDPNHVAVADEVESRVRGAAAELGLPLHLVETNVRELSNLLVPWEAYFACPLAAIALFFEPLFDRVLIAGDTDYETQEEIAFGAIWTIDQLWSTENLEIVDWGGRLGRIERIRRVAGNPVARGALRTCWQNLGGAYNCGRCSKCLMAMTALEALGLREQVTSFPPELDLGAIAGLQMKQRIQLLFWEDLLATARGVGRTDIARAVEPFIASGRVRLGLPPSFRARPHADAATRWPPQRRIPGGPALLAEPATAARIAAAGAIAVLVGSYDGSGNFGDVAQLEAALELLAPLGPDLLVLTVIERGAADAHHRPAGSPTRGAQHIVYFDPEGAGAEGLVPVVARAGLSFGACYLYGGGYLNPSWGTRKLAMLGAAEALLAGTGRVSRLATGLQVDRDWLVELTPDERGALRNFDLLGGRDPRSTAALAELDPAGEVLETGDDAVAVLQPRPAGDRPRPGERSALRVNLHFADHTWVTAHPQAMLDFHAALLVELGELAGRPVRALPLIAYLDPRTDERPGLARLQAALAGRGVELAPPRLIRAAGLDSDLAELDADLTLTCSYHVALTSLLLGVPAALLADTPYYEQKAAGLAATFSLPPALICNSEEEPAAVARRLATTVLDPALGAELRGAIETGGALVRARRAAAERAVLSHLGAGALGALAGVEARAQAQLGSLLGSRSWRATEPLRRAQRLLARAGRGRR